MAATPVRVLTTQLVGERGADEWTRRTIERDLSADVLQQNFTSFLGNIHSIFFQDPGELQNLLLDEVHISAEIDGNGQFRLNSGSATPGGGGISIVVRRRRKEETANVYELHFNTPHSPLNLAGPRDPANAAQCLAVPLGGPLTAASTGNLAVPLAGPLNSANTGNLALPIAGPVTAAAGGNLAVPLAGPSQTTVPVLLSGMVNPAPGPLAVAIAP